MKWTSTRAHGLLLILAVLCGLVAAPLRQVGAAGFVDPANDQRPALHFYLDPPSNRPFDYTMIVADEGPAGWAVEDFDNQNPNPETDHRIVTYPTLQGALAWVARVHEEFTISLYLIQ